MANEKIIEEIDSLIIGICSIDLKDYTREGGLPNEVNFMEFSNEISNCLKFIKALDTVNWHLFPDPLINDALNRIKDIGTALDGLRKFVLGGNVDQERSNAINKLKNAYKTAFVTLAFYVDSVFLSEQQDQIKSQLGQYVARFDQLLAEGDTLLEDFKKTKGSADNTLKDMKQMAKDGALSEHSSIFYSQSKRHFWFSIAWSVAALFSCLGLIWWVSGEMKALANIIDNKTEIVLIPYLVFRAVILSVFSFAIMWCRSSFKANWHNSALNKHRGNALAAFRVFAEGAENDESVKNAILMEATKCIFAPQPTGLLKSDVDSGGQLQVVEILKDITGRSSG